MLENHGDRALEPSSGLVVRVRYHGSDCSWPRLIGVCVFVMFIVNPGPFWIGLLLVGWREASLWRHREDLGT